jgi:hypothetical protein
VISVVVRFGMGLWQVVRAVLTDVSVVDWLVMKNRSCTFRCRRTCGTPFRLFRHEWLQYSLWCQAQNFIRRWRLPGILWTSCTKTRSMWCFCERVNSKIDLPQLSTVQLNQTPHMRLL